MRLKLSFGDALCGELHLDEVGRAVDLRPADLDRRHDARGGGIWVVGRECQRVEMVHLVGEGDGPVRRVLRTDTRHASACHAPLDAGISQASASRASMPSTGKRAETGPACVGCPKSAEPGNRTHPGDVQQGVEQIVSPGQRPVCEVDSCVVRQLALIVVPAPNIGVVLRGAAHTQVRLRKVPCVSLTGQTSNPGPTLTFGRLVVPSSTDATSGPNPADESAECTAAARDARAFRDDPNAAPPPGSAAVAADEKQAVA